MFTCLRMSVKHFQSSYTLKKVFKNACRSKQCSCVHCALHIHTHTKPLDHVRINLLTYTQSQIKIRREGNTTICALNRIDSISWPVMEDDWGKKMVWNLYVSQADEIFVWRPKLESVHTDKTHENYKNEVDKLRTEVNIIVGGQRIRSDMSNYP